jgi:thiol-disulfide isomerase/thioredoxin
MTPATDDSLPVERNSLSHVWLTFWLILAVIFAVVFAWRGLARPDVPLASLKLTGLTPGAKDLSLADLHGRIALVNFWGTWCPPCREEFPHIVAMHGKWRESPNVVIVPVSCGSSGTSENLDELRQETLAFLTHEHAELPVYADPIGATRQAVGDAIGFEGYPTTIVLDRQGIIRGHWVGYVPGYETQMDLLIERILDE